MTTVDRINPTAESAPLREPAQLPLVAMRWLLISVITLIVWVGAAVMAVSAAHGLTDLTTGWAWFVGVSATLPVALSVFPTLDSLIETPSVAGDL